MKEDTFRLKVSWEIFIQYFIEYFVGHESK